MPLKYSTAVRNAKLDAVETAIGNGPILTIRTGAAPANPAAANSGTVLATIQLPADWMSAAANGVKNMTGSWSDSAADAAGTAAHFRIHDSAGTVCHIQGTVSGPGGGGDMIIDNPAFAAGQAFEVMSFALTGGNA